MLHTQYMLVVEYISDGWKFVATSVATTLAASTNVASKSVQPVRY